MINLKDLTLSQLTDFIVSLGEPKYKAKQIFSWLYKNVKSIDEMTDISKALSLDKLALKSRSLFQLGKKNIADLFESLIGAVYLDGGISEAEKLIDKYIIKDMENIRFVLKNSIDYKSKFQEYMQSLAKSFEYKTISSTGLDHEKIHTVGLWVDGEKITEATASSKQVAEGKCAEFYIKKYTDFKTDFE